MSTRAKSQIRRLYQRVAMSIQNDIVAGEYKPGERLPAERLLAQKYEVSRPTIREAIISLEISELAEVRVGAGVFVIDHPQTSAKSLELDVGPFELMEARRSIEGEACAIAARNISDIQLAQLEKHLDRMKVENTTAEISETADRDFHMTIAEATQNSAIVSVVEHLWNIRETSPMLVRMLQRSREAGVRPIIADHSRILEAIKSGDSDSARLAMREHLTRVIDNLLEVTELEAIEQAKMSSNSLRNRYRSGA